MLITLTWLRLDGLRRWRSLAVLALLIALATATILTSIAGARRGQSAFDRLWARTLPATATVLPNQPGFDWARIAALPEVSALTRFPVMFGFAVQGYPRAERAGSRSSTTPMTRTIERPVMLAGRLFNPRRADEVLVTPKFAATFGKQVGGHADPRAGQPAAGQRGVRRNHGRAAPRARGSRSGSWAWPARPWGYDADIARRSAAASSPRPALFTRYRANMLGTNRPDVRQRAGPAQRRRRRDPALPRRPGPGDRAADIDVWDNAAHRRSRPPGHRVRGGLPAGFRGSRRWSPRCS